VQNKKIIFLNCEGGYITLKAALLLIYSHCSMKPLLVLHCSRQQVDLSAEAQYVFSLESLAAGGFQRFYEY